jgi:hypothetical protein
LEELVVRLDEEDDEVLDELEDDEVLEELNDVEEEVSSLEELDSATIEERDTSTGS